MGAQHLYGLCCGYEYLKDHVRIMHDKHPASLAGLPRKSCFVWIAIQIHNMAAEMKLYAGGPFGHDGQQPIRGKAVALQQPYTDESIRAVQPDLAIR